jgi:serine protease DegS
MRYRKLLVGFVIGLLLTLHSIAYAYMDRVNVYINAVPSVVQVKAGSSVEDIALAGAGVVVGYGYVLTTKHLVQDGGKVSEHIVITTYLGEEREVRRCEVDPDEDFDLLEVDTSGLRPIRYDLDRPALPGEEIIVIGYPLFNVAYGVFPSVYSGWVANCDMALASGYPYVGLLQIDAFIAPGSSGGPVIREDGSLVGLVYLLVAVSSGKDTYHNLYFALPIQKASRLLSKISY